jgi:hypothetical protein
MNATEEDGELYLGTKCCLIGNDLYGTSAFNEMFLERPCKGCGADHTLLREIGRVNGVPQYDYRCNVIDHKPLYREEDNGQLRVLFRLRVRPFILDCGYDLDQAIARLTSLRGNPVGDHETPELFDSFANEARTLIVVEQIRRLGR